MKIKIRLKLEEGGGEPQPRRVFVGELLSPDPDYPQIIKDNFVIIKGKHLVLERHQAITRALEDEDLHTFLVPISRIDWITVLPDEIDLKKLKYKIVGERILCPVSGKEFTLKEAGESGV